MAPGVVPTGTGTADTVPPAAVPMARPTAGRPGTGRQPRPAPGPPGRESPPGRETGRAAARSARRRKVPPGTPDLGLRAARRLALTIPPRGTRRPADGRPAVPARGHRGTGQAAARPRPGTTRCRAGRPRASAPRAIVQAPARDRRTRLPGRHLPFRRNPDRRSLGRRSLGRRSLGRQRRGQPGRHRSPSGHAGPARFLARRSRGSHPAGQLPP